MTHHWKSGNIRIVALCFALTICASLAAAQRYPSLAYTVTNEAIVGSQSVQAGFYTLTIKNESDLEAVNIAVADVAEGATVEEVMSATEAVNMAFEGQGDIGQAISALAGMLTFVTGSSTPDGVMFELMPGEYLVYEFETARLHTTLHVSDAGEKQDAPMGDVVVDMQEFAFSMPDMVKPGEQTWEVRNVGEQVHHMAVFQVKEGYTLEDVTAFMEDQEGEPPLEDVANTAVLSPGVTNYVTYDLPPGRYLVLCFLPDYETGQPHFLLGMMDDFVVTEQ